jgi:hypothetical protein
MTFLKRRGLLLVLVGVFLCLAVMQAVAGRSDLNSERSAHGVGPLAWTDYLQSGHYYEALLENWESEFLEMGVFVVLTVALYARGSAESRRPGVTELVDADPRAFAHLPDVPWPVRRGGWVLWVYERSLGIAFGILFLIAWAGHALTGWRTARGSDQLHGHAPESFTTFVSSAHFWFQTLQNWQSEFLGIASMVWLSIYLRQRGSPESKPVHAPHTETGR